MSGGRLVALKTRAAITLFGNGWMDNDIAAATGLTRRQVHKITGQWPTARANVNQSSRLTRRQRRSVRMATTGERSGDAGRPDQGDEA